MLLLALNVVLIYPTFGFLLTNGGKNPGSQSSEECLKVSDYFDYQEIHQRQMNSKLALLSSQLAKKFSELVHINNEIQNSSKKDTCESKYNLLEDNYQKLQKRVENLQAENNAQQQELLSVKNLTNELETLKVRNALQNREIVDLKNKTTANEQNISNVAALKNLKPILELQSLQQHVQVLDSTTHLLSVHEHARNQDFLALYNETVKVKGILNNISVNTSNHFIRMERSQNATRQYMEEYEGRQNKTNAMFTRSISANSEQIALTACTYGESYAVGDVLKFINIKHEEGITDISAFKSSGKFICEKEGLYYMSVSILSKTSEARFYIYKNASVVSWAYLSNDDHFDMATASGSANLKKSDFLLVKATSDFAVASDWSCLTIIKIK